ncbi:MAG TPA: sensor histidine kinase [Steroidobacteraceae bacterium]|nr:sensor histidine kinase [Steroidobacteraceae bacterium]
MGPIRPAGLNRLRRRLLGDHEFLGWGPFLWLLYLVYLFLPLVILPRGDLRWLWPTLLTIPPFLFLYFYRYRNKERGLACVLGIALLSYVLTPFNPAAFTYLTYAAAASTYVVRGLLRALLLTLGLLAVQAVETLYLHQSPLDIAVAVVVCLMCCLITQFQVEGWRRSEALKLSHEEIRRLAAVAERERIGRDLHDLLGHTLSLIALKSELAGKLIERDPRTALREINGVTEVAREALRQVRTAVMGIRSAELASELVSAQALLASCGIELTCTRDEASLPAQVETALAMVVREAVTNIQRHAEAKRARIELTVARVNEESTLRLLIVDDGRGGAVAQAGGNGLAGMAERVRSLGGLLQVESPHGRGTCLRATLPLKPTIAEVQAVRAVG